MYGKKSHGTYGQELRAVAIIPTIRTRGGQGCRGVLGASAIDAQVLSEEGAVDDIATAARILNEKAVARRVAQASLVTGIDVDVSDGILRPYFPHVARVDCMVEFNTADLAL